MRKKFFLMIVVLLLVLVSGFLFLFIPARAEKINYGVVFIQKHAESLGLDWKETYLALLDDLKVDNLKISAQWNLVEPIEGNYDFSDLDWQLDRAAERGTKVMLIVGMKTSRWPECHLPEWAKSINKGQQQDRITELVKTIVNRYKNRQEISAWQVENEPLFPFGECPWSDKAFLTKEVELVRSLDSQKRPVVISDSGEGSWWFNAAQIGDVAAVTMYRGAYFNQIGRYVDYPLPPTYYWVKKELVSAIFKKPVICGELQAEPWCKSQLYNCSIVEQEKSMNLARLKENLSFAKKTGIDTFYLWGAEWWYLMKTKQNDPSYWEEAKKLWR